MKLSLIITARNDNHGGDFLARLTKSVTENVKILRQHLKMDFEYVIVDWGSEENTPLYSNPRMIEVNNLKEVRFVIVPKELIIEKYGSNRFFQFFAKNVGIRKADGDWVLIFNADNIIKESLAKKIRNVIQNNSDKEFYRIKWWVCNNGDKTKRINSSIGSGPLAEEYAGDFLLCRRDIIIEKGRGYDEENSGHKTDLSQAQMDGEILYNLKNAGLRINILDDEILHIYHPKGTSFDTAYNQNGYENSDDWGMKNNPIDIKSDRIMTILPLNDTSIKPETNQVFQDNIEKKASEIAVVITVWKRTDRLEEMLLQIREQTFKDFDVYLINNNPENTDCVNDIVSNISGMNIKVFHNDFNMAFLARHLLSKRLNESGYKYIIMLDDDVCIETTAFETLNNEKCPKSAFSILALDFENNFDRIKRSPSKYIGPGGMIIDASIFSDVGFWMNWLPEYYSIDDIWLSYYAGKQNWSCFKSKANMKLLDYGPKEIKSIENPSITVLRKDFSEKYRWTTLFSPELVKQPIARTSVSKQTMNPSINVINRNTVLDQILFKRISVKMNPVILDVGACECEDSIRYKKIFPRAKIFAFEPVETNYQKCLKAVSCQAVSVVNSACSDVDGTAEIWISSGNPIGKPNTDTHNFGNKSSSLLKPKLHLDIHPWCEFKEKQKVKTQRLDSFCSQNGIGYIDFIHMDVQGFELNVLKGLGGMLKNTELIWLEVENVELYEGQPLKKDIEKFMTENGFTKQIDTVGNVSGDQLWINSSIKVNLTETPFQTDKRVREAGRIILSPWRKKWS